MRQVAPSPYLIDHLPVTNAQFAAFVAADGYRTRRFWTEAGWRFLQDSALAAPNCWNGPHWNAPDLPVTGISGREARA